MSHRARADLGSLDLDEPGESFSGRAAEVYSTAAAFYVVLLKNRYFDEASEFAEWFLDTFDLDLES